MRTGTISIKYPAESCAAAQSQQVEQSIPTKLQPITAIIKITQIRAQTKAGLETGSTAICEIRLTCVICGSNKQQQG